MRSISPTGRPFVFPVAILVATLIPAFALAAPRAAPRATTPAPAIERIAACKGIGEDTARLACFDRTSAELASAVSTRELVVVSRAELRATRASLFGLAVPRGGLLDADGTAVDKLETTVRSATTGTDGNATVTLANGQVWQQVDGRMLGRDPRGGMKVVITRGRLGRYDLSVEGGPSRQVRRSR